MPVLSVEEIEGRYSQGELRALSLVRALAHYSKEVEGYSKYALLRCKENGLVSAALEIAGSGSYVPYDPRAEAALNQLNIDLEAFFDLSTSTAKSYRQLRKTYSTLKQMIDESSERAKALIKPTILSKEDSDRFIESLQKRFSYLVFLAAVHFGPDALSSIQDFEFGIGYQAIDELALAEDELLTRVEAMPPLGAWKISPYDASDGFLSGVKGYSLDYLDKQSFETQKEGSKKLAENLWQKEGDWGPSFLGIGYVVGPAPLESFKLRSPDTHASLNIRAFEQSNWPVNDILADLRNSYFDGDDAFLFHPDDLALALDRASRAHCVRKQQRVR